MARHSLLLSIGSQAIRLPHRRHRRRRTIILPLRTVTAPPDMQFSIPIASTGKRKAQRASQVGATLYLTPPFRPRFLMVSNWVTIGMR